jgi:PLP dependent protein
MSGSERVGHRVGQTSRDGGQRRRAELAANLDAARAAIAEACRQAGRAPEEVTLIVVTKTWPEEDVRLLAGLGVRDVGENRDQEASGKARACRDLDLSWHFLGQLQTNKCRSVVRYADVVHSVDRTRLVRALSAAAVAAGREISCLVQVNLDPPDQVVGPGVGRVRDDSGAAAQGRGGAAPEAVARLADVIAEAPGLRLGGLMAVAPPPGPSGSAGDAGQDADGPRAAFERLAALAADLRERHPPARVISAGMSGDFRHAIAAGATHVRLGTAVLGARPILR